MKTKEECKTCEEKINVDLTVINNVDVLRWIGEAELHISELHTRCDMYIEEILALRERITELENEVKDWAFDHDRDAYYKLMEKVK